MPLTGVPYDRSCRRGRKNQCSAGFIPAKVIVISLYVALLDGRRDDEYVDRRRRLDLGQCSVGVSAFGDVDQHAV